MKQGFLFFAGICGILTPIIALSSIFLSATYSPNFSWTENWISDLGGRLIMPPMFPLRPDVSTPTTALILNAGLLLSGILGFIFAVGLWKSMKMPSGRIGSLIIIITSIALFNIGLFPEPTGMPHVIASLACFILGPIGILYIGAASMDSDQKLLGYSMLILGIIVVIFGGPLIFFGAIPELISGLAFFIFMIVFGVKMTNQSQKLIL